MANFDWRRVADGDLGDRYRDDVLGQEAWLQLLGVIRDYLNAETFARVFEAFDDFLRRLRQLEGGPGVCRVFVSHQQADIAFAERVAYLVDREGYEYWLDVHDPLLRLANIAGLPPVVRSVLIAAIIEMALLNCTHGISIQTHNAQKSRWVPYEFGRAKRRWLVSTQVASWFDNGVYAATTADYLKLGVCAQSERDVVRWLTLESARCQCPRVPPRWQKAKPNPLPN